MSKVFLFQTTAFGKEAGLEKQFHRSSGDDVAASKFPVPAPDAFKIHIRTYSLKKTNWQRTTDDFVIFSPLSVLIYTYVNLPYSKYSSSGNLYEIPFFSKIMPLTFVENTSHNCSSIIEQA